MLQVEKTTEKTLHINLNFATFIVYHIIHIYILLIYIFLNLKSCIYCHVKLCKQIAVLVVTITLYKSQYKTLHATPHLGVYIYIYHQNMVSDIKT